MVEELPLLDPVDAELPATAATPTRRKKTEERLALRAAEAVLIQAQPLDVVDLVASFCSATTLPAASTPASRGPRRRRKARFNKTGWDKVSKHLYRFRSIILNIYISKFLCESRQ